MYKTGQKSHRLCETKAFTLHVFVGEFSFIKPYASGRTECVVKTLTVLF